ncbi:MAG: hypothetical protein ACLFOA_01420 [Desulfohalobiaceae bacterium]
MRTRIKNFLQRTNSFRDKMDSYQKSITFAEAGESAPGPATELEATEKQPGYLLVIGSGSYFSQRIINQAIDLARCMSYKIIALNIAPLPEQTKRYFSLSQTEMQKFEEASQENAELFAEKSKEMEISFSHVVRFGETDQVINALQKEFKEIEFVISEEEQSQANVVAVNENSCEKPLCVYATV